MSPPFNPEARQLFGVKRFAACGQKPELQKRCGHFPPLGFTSGEEPFFLRVCVDLNNVPQEGFMLQKQLDSPSHPRVSRR